MKVRGERTWSGLWEISHLFLLVFDCISFFLCFVLIRIQIARFFIALSDWGSPEKPTHWEWQPRTSFKKSGMPTQTKLAWIGQTGFQASLPILRRLNRTSEWLLFLTTTIPLKLIVKPKQLWKKVRKALWSVMWWEASAWGSCSSTWGLTMGKCKLIWWASGSVF